MNARRRLCQVVYLAQPSILRSHDSIKLQGFVAGTARLAALVSVDLIVVWTETLHRLKTPINGVVITIVRLTTRAVGVDVHPLISQVATGDDHRFFNHGEIGTLGGHGRSNLPINLAHGCEQSTLDGNLGEFHLVGVAR